MGPTSPWIFLLKALSVLSWYFRYAVTVIPLQLSLMQMRDKLTEIYSGTYLRLDVCAAFGIGITYLPPSSHGSITICLYPRVRRVRPRCYSQTPNYYHTQHCADQSLRSIYPLRGRCILRSLVDNELDLWRYVTRCSSSPSYTPRGFLIPLWVSNSMLDISNSI